MKHGSIVRLWRSRSKYEKALFLVFLASLPFLHPLVNGDGVGYYAYVRSPLVDHDLQFLTDWKDPVEELEKIFLLDHFVLNPVTKTGHLPNYYSVGPAMLWSPFLAVTHLAVLGLRRMGCELAPDGHSWPYLATMAFATAVYGFAGLCFSFGTARRFVDERWAFWATLGIWLGSGLPAYMYLLPAWSHTHSAFATALFLWYWVRTRGTRTVAQWLVLGLLSGLMVDVYQLNGVFCLAAAGDALASYAEIWRAPGGRREKLVGALGCHLTYALGMLLALAPTFVAREIVFGSPFAVGPYTLRLWNWTSPAFAPVLFSSSHGLLVFAPIVVLAMAGWLWLRKLDRSVGDMCLLVTLIFYVLICCFPWPLGAVGFGNRFFVSLTPIFVLGLAASFAWAAGLWRDARTAALRIVPVTVLFIVWNLGLVYQWQTHLLPRYGPVYWDELLYNQFRVVPGQALRDLGEKLRLR
jgi:hypothetical protein